MNMTTKIGDLVRIRLTAEWEEVGIVIKKSTGTLPEMVFVKTLDGRIAQAYEGECEMINSV